MQVVLLLLLRLPAIQTKVVQYAAAQLSKKTGTPLNLRYVYLDAFTNLTLEGLYAEDLEGDTLLYIGSLKADFSLQWKPLVFDLKIVGIDSLSMFLKKYKDPREYNIDYILAHLSSSEKDTTSSEGLEIEFIFGDLQISNSTFYYHDYKWPAKERLIFDENRLAVYHINGRFHGLTFSGDTIFTRIENLSGNERSGLELKNLTADVSLCPTKTHLRNASILTAHSDVKGDIAFLTDSFPDFQDFITHVRWDADFDTSLVSFIDINYFARSFDGITDKVRLKTQVKGTVENFKARNLFASFHSGTIIKGHLDMKGLPEIDDTYLYLDARELITRKKSLESLHYIFGEDSTFRIPDNFYQLGLVHYKGILSGFINDMVAYGNFRTDLGNLRTDVSFRYDEKRDITAYEGRMRAENFHMGKFFYLNPELKHVSFDAQIKGSGLSLENVDANFNGSIFSLHLHNYTYHNIKADAHIKNQLFDGKLSINDPNLKLDFNGQVNFSGKVPEMDFTANLTHAKLGKLKLYNMQDTLSNLSTTARINLTGSHIDNLQGNIELLQTFYSDSDDKLHINAIDFFVDETGKEKVMIFTSDVLDAEIQGKFNLSTLPVSISHFLSAYLPGKFNPSTDASKLNEDFRFNISFIDPEDLLHAATGFIRVGSNSSLSGRFSLRDNDFQVKGFLTYLEIYDTKIYQSLLTGKAIDSTIYFNMGSKKFAISENLYIENFNLNNEITHNKIQTNINWENNTTQANKGNLNVDFSFTESHRIKGRFNDSYMYISDTLWKINEANTIHIDSALVKIENFSIKSNSSALIADGALSNKPNQQVDIVVQNINLDYLNTFIIQRDAQLGGILNGTISVSGLQQTPRLGGDVSIVDLSLNNTLLGNGILKTDWNADSRILSMKGNFKRGSIPVLDFNGNIFPGKSGEELSLLVNMNKTELSLLEPFARDIFSDITGYVSGSIGLYGSLKNPITDGSLTLEKVSFKTDYLNTRYELQGKPKVVFESDMIYMNNAHLIDERGNKAFVNATVFHENFEKITYDIGIFSKNFMFLNTTLAQNDLYYGTAMLSGIVNISGHDELVLIDAVVKTEKGTFFNIPLDGPEEVSEYGFITFASTKDTMQVNKQTSTAMEGVTLSLDLNVTSDAEVKIIFDEKVGDIMRGRGAGNIRMGISSNGDFTMYGDYVVEEGDYLFTLQNIINKKFVVERGGRIRWNGSPYDAEIDLNAVYKLRASLQDIIRDSSDVYKKRVPVDVRMRLYNNLMQPDIDFDIHLPGVDENTRQRVRSVLYVNNAETNNQEMSRQVFSLLVLNRFLTPSGLDPTVSNNADNPNFGAQSSSELLSNQISNWLSQISNQFDVGFSYRPGTELTNDEVELALSTQIFNDRVVLDGNVGYLNSSQVAGNSNNLVSDFAIEYKVTPDGKLRVKAFNRSNVNNFMLNNAPYTQGAGFFYRKEFDRFGDLFIRKRKNKEKTKEVPNTENSLR